MSLQQSPTGLRSWESSRSKCKNTMRWQREHTAAAMRWLRDYAAAAMQLIIFLSVFTAAIQISMRTKIPVENSGLLAADGPVANSSSVATGGSAADGGSAANSSPVAAGSSAAKSAMQLINFFFTVANDISMRTKNPVENSGSLAAGSSAADGGSAADSSPVPAGGCPAKGDSAAKMVYLWPNWGPPRQYRILCTAILVIASVTVCACAYTAARGETAAIKRSAQRDRQAAATTTFVLVMLMLTTAGATVEMGESAEAKIVKSDCADEYNMPQLIDMSKIATVSGKRYCKMIVESETRFAQLNGMVDMPWFSVAMGIFSILIMVVAQWAAPVGMGAEAVSMLRWAAGLILDGAEACTCAAMMLVILFLVGIPPAAAYSVAGTGNRAQAPEIYPAMHMGTRAKLKSEKERQHTLSQVTEFIQEQLENDVLRRREGEANISCELKCKIEYIIRSSWRR